MKFDLDLNMTKLKQLNKRQKTLIPLIILAFIYVIWQLFALFGSPSISVDNTPQQVSQKADKTDNISSRLPSVEDMSAAEPAPSLASAPQSKEVGDLSLGKDQAQYIQLLNQYQMLKMKRMLLEEQVSIATARQKIAELNAKTDELGGSTDADFGGDNSFGGDNNADVTAMGQGGEYKVVYIDHQNGEWNATLNHNGHFEEVNVGSEMADGTQVIAIDSQGVVIKKGTNVTKLTFSGAVVLDAAAKSSLIQSPAQASADLEKATKATNIESKEEKILNTPKKVKQTQIEVSVEKKQEKVIKSETDKDKNINLQPTQMQKPKSDLLEHQTKKSKVLTSGDATEAPVAINEPNNKDTTDSTVNMVKANNEVMNKDQNKKSHKSLTEIFGFGSKSDKADIKN